VQTWLLIFTKRVVGEPEATEIIIPSLVRLLMRPIMMFVHVMMLVAMISRTALVMPLRPLPAKVSTACQAMNTTSACAPRPNVR